MHHAEEKIRFLSWLAIFHFNWPLFCIFECVLLDVLVGHLREMHVKWPVATCYFCCLRSSHLMHGHISGPVVSLVIHSQPMWHVEPLLSIGSNEVSVPGQLQHRGDTNGPFVDMIEVVSTE